MKLRSFQLLMASAAFVLAAAATPPTWRRTARASKAAADSPASLPDQEIGRRITVKAEDLPPPKTGPIVGEPLDDAALHRPGAARAGRLHRDRLRHRA